jgi:hypothetical protein
MKARDSMAFLLMACTLANQPANATSCRSGHGQSYRLVAGSENLTDLPQGIYLSLADPGLYLCMSVEGGESLCDYDLDAEWTP